MIGVSEKAGAVQIRFIHLFCRPVIRVSFGAPIEISPHAPTDKDEAMRLTAEIDEAMNALRLVSQSNPGFHVDMA